jgi:hypothetical protein
MVTTEFDRSALQAGRTKDFFVTRHLIVLFLSQFIVFVALLVSAPAARANDVYIAPSSMGAANGAGCADALPASFFNTQSNWGAGKTIAPGTTVHLCSGIYAARAGGNVFTFQGGGTSGNPITLSFMKGAIVQAPYCSYSSGCINASGRSHIVIDGSSLAGQIQNTQDGNSALTCPDGSACAYAEPTTLIYLGSCTNCTVQNLNIGPTFINAQNLVPTIVGDPNEVNTIHLGASNQTVSGNYIHDCSWCVLVAFPAGTTNLQIYDNELTEFGHGFAIFPSASNGTLDGFYFHDNDIHDTDKFDTYAASGNPCEWHVDGIHSFGSGTPSDPYSEDHYYIYNNWWHGYIGGCTQGNIFIEGGGSSSTNHLHNAAVWNNIFDGQNNAGTPLGNGLVSWFYGDTSVQFYNNTLLWNNTSQASQCYNIGHVTNFSFIGNVSSGCNLAVNFGTLTGITNVDYNIYGGACGLSNNCLVVNGSFSGNFSSYKTSVNSSLAGCSTCESHSLAPSYSSMLLNSDGSPQASSPVIRYANNLGSLATVALATLAQDTSKGNNQTPRSRPAPGICSLQGTLPCWDVGAYSHSSASSGNTVNPPSGLLATVQ